MQVALVARNTFRESVRDRILYNLILFALVMMGASLVIGELAIGGEHKIIVDLGLSSMRFFGMLIAIFIGIQLVYKEIERRTIFSLLAKPLRRSDLILGKFAGLSFTLLVNSSVMLAGILLCLTYLDRGMPRGAGPVATAAYLIFLELLVTTSIALAFSTMSSPVVSAIFTALLYIIGNFSANLLAMAEAAESAAAKGLFLAAYYVLPNLSNFNAIASAAHGVPITGARVAAATVYAAVYCALLLSICVIVFERRDFK
jgi:ABC-type transport system involved in multi-copper enzyme maturation permease subunit